MKHKILTLSPCYEQLTANITGKIVYISMETLKQIINATQLKLALNKKRVRAWLEIRGEDKNGKLN